MNVTYGNLWWLKDKEAPFATLLSVIQASCHPEVYYDNYQDLVDAARDPQPGDRMRRFKEELRAAMADPSQIPTGALSQAAQYDEGSDDKFLHRLWHDLYGDEPATPPA